VHIFHANLPGLYNKRFGKHSRNDDIFFYRLNPDQDEHQDFFMASREQFSSKTGFILAATGSAVGLGNIWGFPTQTASNGGAAFVLVYLVLAFCLAYPALMAELVIGRYAQANAVTALRRISTSRFTWWMGSLVGFSGIITVSLILSFYGIVAGWMLAFLFGSFADLFGIGNLAAWLTESGLLRNLVFMAIFMILTMSIVSRGVASGIERWSTRLMPLLIVILLALIVYVLMQKGAAEGLRVYLLPNFSQISPGLVLNAMGQAFFSMSLGVGGMLIYGSYLSGNENLPRLGAIVTLVDVGIAFLAGLLIIPAVYVAQQFGADIYGEGGGLIAGPDMIFQILPYLFDSMGTAGPFVAMAFFALMTIAALTSTIAMLEPAVSLVSEETRITRRPATWLIGTVICVLSTVIALNFDLLFDLVLTLTTKYSQPLLGVMFCIFVGWIWNRNQVLQELRRGCENMEQSLFWKIWPFYVKVFCPVLILAAFIQSLMV
jgi:NSS family neurotransmitter:Na+ symporter